MVQSITAIPAPMAPTPPPVPSGFDASRLKGGVPLTNRFADSVPANWTITVSEQKPGEIHSKNIVTGSEFTGTPKAFGKYLRGEL